MAPCADGVSEACTTWGLGPGPGLADLCWPSPRRYYNTVTWYCTVLINCSSLALQGLVTWFVSDVSSCRYSCTSSRGSCVSRLILHKLEWFLCLTSDIAQARAVPVSHVWYCTSSRCSCVSRLILHKHARFLCLTSDIAQARVVLVFHIWCCTSSRGSCVSRLILHKLARFLCLTSDIAQDRKVPVSHVWYCTSSRGSCVSHLILHKLARFLCLTSDIAQARVVLVFQSDVAQACVVPSSSVWYCTRTRWARLEQMSDAWYQARLCVAAWMQTIIYPPGSNDSLRIFHQHGTRLGSDVSRFRYSTAPQWKVSLVSNINLITKTWTIYHTVSGFVVGE